MLGVLPGGTVHRATHDRVVRKGTTCPKISSGIDSSDGRETADAFLLFFNVDDFRPIPSIAPHTLHTEYFTFHLMFHSITLESISKRLVTKHPLLYRG